MAKDQNAAVETAPEIQTWNFNGKDYPLFLADKNDSVGIQITRANSDDVIGILGANFRWEKSDPFMDHLNLEWKDVIDKKENVLEQHRKNLTRQNAKLFKEICVGGFLIRINEFGEQAAPVEKSIEDMHRYPTETQSKLIDTWLSGFHIERYFPEGVDELDALLGAADAIYFICYVGARKEPSNAILFKFDIPSEDARRTFEDNNVKRQSEMEGTNETVYIDINFGGKLKYAKKHLSEVKGAGVQVDGYVHHVNPNDGDTLKTFKDSFNPEWFTRLGDALQDTFRIGGKLNVS